MKKHLLFLGIIFFAFISCRETPSPAPKTPPVNDQKPAPDPETNSDKL